MTVTPPGPDCHDGHYRGLGNLGRAVVRDPIWALIAVVTSPIRFFRYLVTTFIVFVLTAAVLIVLAMLLKYGLHIPDKSPVDTALGIGIIVILLLVLVRMATVPLLNHFGDTGPSDVDFHLGLTHLAA